MLEAPIISQVWRGATVINRLRVYEPSGLHQREMSRESFCIDRDIEGPVEAVPMDRTDLQRLDDQIHEPE